MKQALSFLQLKINWSFSSTFSKGSRNVPKQSGEINMTLRNILMCYYSCVTILVLLSDDHLRLEDLAKAACPILNSCFYNAESYVSMKKEER